MIKTIDEQTAFIIISEWEEGSKENNGFVFS